MKNLKLYVQGDVVIKQVRQKPKGKKLDTLVLAEGEATGHMHKITSGKATLYSAADNSFLQVKDTAILEHPEHKVVTLPRGNYVFEKAKEYDHFAEEARRVID